MHIETMLDDPATSMMIVTQGKTRDIVVGVPHHAPLGVAELPCEEHRDADENAGVLGYYLSRLLDCPSIIACNYFLDPNKHMDSDYFGRIRSWKPKILTEIHGHGGKSAKFDIEISSGSAERNVWSGELAARLATRLSSHPNLQGYSLSGDFNKIHFQATKSLTIVRKEWIALHVELPKSIREARSQYALLCESLAESLKEILAKFDEISRVGSPRTD